MNGAHFSTGHVANDNSRMHIGDAYHGNLSNTSNYTVHVSVSNERSSRPRKRSRSESSEGGRDTRGAKKLMNSLHYEGLDYRKESLEGPQPQTFEWIFDVSGEQHLPERDEYGYRNNERLVKWPSFPSWLESPDSISPYCLIGKVGSGKSTLIAWISRDRATQTEFHLCRWGGSRPVCILTHFLFRPSGESLGRNFEGLLRSLLFQALSSLPELQAGVASKYTARSNRGQTSRWAVRVLKEMLKHVLHSATQFVFCIFIDGVDELQDDGETGFDSNDLIEYLVDLQHPKHIKMCLSSRPTVNKMTRLPCASETTLRLTDLNRIDIATYVRGKIHDCVALHDSDPHQLSHEICARADGVFLWAVFAVREIVKWADTEEIPMLVQRLNKMGGGLEQIFAYMLNNIEHEHRRSLAFYLKVMKWSKMGIIERPPNIALLVASQQDIQERSYKSLLRICEIEERRITQWSHGMLEVPPATHNQVTKCRAQLLAWIPSSLVCRKNERHTPLVIPNSLRHDWMVTELDDHGRNVQLFNLRRVTWVHRSAYDFFFAPVGRRHSEEIDELLRTCEDHQVTRSLLQGYRSIALMLPHACRHPGFGCLTFSFQRSVYSMIRIAGYAADLLKECHDEVLSALHGAILTWKHQGTHSGLMVIRPQAFEYYTFDYYQDSDHCFMVHDIDAQPCVESACAGSLDLGPTGRDHATSLVQSILTASDARGSICGTLSEFMFWDACTRRCLSFTMQRCAELHNRRTGGLMLAGILNALLTPRFFESLPAREIQFEAQLLDQIASWNQQYMSAPGLDTIHERITSSHIYRPLCGRVSISWSPRHERDLTSTQGTDVDENVYHHHEHDLECQAQMVLALTEAKLRYTQHILHCRLSEFLDEWDAWFEISPDRFSPLVIMIPVTEAPYLRTGAFNRISRLRLLSSDRRRRETKLTKVAHHLGSSDVTQLFSKICIDTQDESLPRFWHFLLVVEDLLQDVHQNHNLKRQERKPIEDAIIATAAAETERMMNVRLYLQRWVCSRGHSLRPYKSALSMGTADMWSNVEIARNAKEERLRRLVPD